MSNTNSATPCVVHMNMSKDANHRVYCTDCDKYLTHAEIVAAPAEVSAPKATPCPWGIEATRYTLWVGTLKNVGTPMEKCDDVICSFDIEAVTPGYEKRQRANAELIVAAVNSYDSSQATIRQLTEALEACVEVLRLNQQITGAIPMCKHGDLIPFAEAVLAEVARHD